jgi:hypothetical protein
MNSTGNSIQVIETSFKKKYWDQFLNFPWCIYSNDRQWVPPLLFEQQRQLDPIKNPFFRNAEARYWLAYKGGKCSGRIAAIIDKQYNDYYGTQVGFFGFFESVNDLNVVNELFSKAIGWLHSKGIKKILGPVNLSTANECGLLINGFHQSPFVQMAHNPIYYRELLEQNGFTKEIDLLAYYTPAEINNNATVMGKLKRVSDYITQKEGITFRTLLINRFDEELETIRNLYNEFMSENWGFVPVDKEEFKFMTSSLRQVLISDLAVFAEVRGKPVGFSVGIPDINQVMKRMNGKLFPFGILKYFYYKPKITEFRVMLMGVNKEYRKKGLEGVFIYHTITEGVKKRFKGAELSWVAEDNEALIRELNFLGSQLYKTYRIYSKNISA